MAELNKKSKRIRKWLRAFYDKDALLRNCCSFNLWLWYV